VYLYNFVQAVEICLASNKVVPKKLHVPKFIKCIETQCPVTHLKFYCNKMEATQPMNQHYLWLLNPSKIKNTYHVSFVSTDTLKLHPEISFDFLLDHTEIVASTNQWVLLYHAYNGPCYYMCNPTTKQWQKILNPKA